MPPCWFERCYRLTSAICKEKFLRRKFFHELKRSLSDQITSSNKTERRHLRQRLCRTGWTPTWVFGPKILATTVIRFKPPRHQPADAHWGKKLARHATATQMSLKLFVHWTWQSIRKGFFMKNHKSFRPRLERGIAAKCGHIEYFDVFGC